MAQVVFARPSTTCDTSDPVTDHAVVVDEEGKFVANLIGGTANAVEVSPGPHAFFVWSQMTSHIPDFHQNQRKRYQPVSVLDRRWEAGTSSLVTVNVLRPDGASDKCFAYNVFYFGTSNERASLDSLGTIRLVDSDAQAGATYLRTHGEVSAVYLKMAREFLSEDRREQERELKKGSEKPNP